MPRVRTLDPQPSQLAASRSRERAPRFRLPQILHRNSVMPPLSDYIGLLRCDFAMVETIEWTDAGVVMIDQRRLPVAEEYITCRSYQEVADAIRGMVIRGAPAIGVAAAMGVALGVLHTEDRDLDCAFPVICQTLAAT